MNLIKLAIVFIVSSALAAAAPFTQIVYEGDSLSAPISDLRSNYYLASNFVYAGICLPVPASVNVAAGGDTIQNMVATYAAQVGPYKTVASGGVAVVFLLAGTNDIFGGRSSSQIVADLNAFWALARADGFKIAAFTIPPSNSFDSAKQAVHDAVNAAIRANHSPYDYLIDPDVLFPNPLNTLDYSDGVHFTTSASSRLGLTVALTVPIPSNPTAVPPPPPGGPIVTTSPITINLDNVFGGLKFNRTSGNTNLYSEYDINGAGQAYFGIAGYAGWFTPGSLVGDAVIRTDYHQILFSVDGGNSTCLTVGMDGRTRFRVTGDVPPTSTSSGVVGTLAADANYIYECVAENQWKRTSLNTW